MKKSAPCAAAGLREYQDGFADALLACGNTEPRLPQIARLVAQPGFAVYRNTVMKGCIDALQANYPAVSRLVGDDWFRAAAARYVSDYPPAHPSLLDYGRDFASFLAAFEPGRQLPYLPAVARLDRFWSEAHIAGDAAPLAAERVAGLNATQLARAVLRPHPAARWAWFAEHPIATIWARNRDPGAKFDAPRGAAPEFAWQAEGMLITRPHGRIEWVQIPEAGCAFLDACARGDTLADAAMAALAVDPDADLALVMTRTLAAGAYAHLAISDESLAGPAR